MRRRICSLLGVLSLLAGLGVTSAVAPTPAGAAPVGITLDMVAGGGILQLRDAEPYSLATPTKITGSQDDVTKNLSGLEFETPEVNIERHITSPLQATVFIDATFSQVTPGTGTVDPDGNMTIQSSLAVDLHIEVIPDGATDPINIPGDCHSEPINLILQSTAPYNPDTNRVTVAAGDFTVPPVTIASNTCNSIVGEEVNKQLAGAGHSLSLLLEGDIGLPPTVGCETTTTLEMDPAGESSLGASVTFNSTTTITDTADPECVAAANEGKVLSGTVDFLRGSTVIGSDEIDGSGEATFSTTFLPAGTHQLSAQFRINLPFKKSSSAAVTHKVTTQPTVSTTLPDFVPLGQEVEFEYTVTNSQFGGNLDDVRVDVTLRSQNASPALDRWDGVAWQPVTVLGARPFRYAALPAFDLAAGASRTERLRLSTVDPTDPVTEPGSLNMQFEVRPNSSEPGPAPKTDALGRGSKVTTLYNTDRQPVEIHSFTDPVPIYPHTVRQGQTVTLEGVQLQPFNFGHTYGGYFEFLLDGQVVPVGMFPGTPRPGEEQLKVPISGGGTGGTALIHLPNNTPTGTREITVRYSGDSLFLPTQVTWPFTVLPARGPSYQCFAEGLPPANFRVNVLAQANVPSAATPGSVDIGNLDISLLTDKSIHTAYQVYDTWFDEGPTLINEKGLKDIRYTFSGGGTGTATTLVQTNPYELSADPNPAPASTVDRVISFNGETGSTNVAGAVGDIVPITLETIEIDVVTPDLGVPYNIVCTPVDDPYTLGEVRITGVDLTVDPAGSVRVGQDVNLTANVGNPTGAGVAEFVDGTDAIGVVPVVNGTAAMTTNELEPGDHTLKVRYYPQPSGPVQVSPEETLEVLPEFDCGDFAIEDDEPNGAVVRLVYMELLNRCPDQAGYDYWLGQLDEGVSPEKFARTIAYTAEALDQVVIDAYQTTLERNPSAEDRVFWRNRLRSNGRYQDLLAALSGSPEFWSLSGQTRAGLVTRVFNRMLNRDPSAADIDYWVGQLLSGLPRSSVMRTIANLREPLGVIVDDSYAEILDTAPTPTERDAAIRELQRTGDRSALYAKLIGDPRFTARAQDFPNF